MTCQYAFLSRFFKVRQCVGQHSVKSLQNAINVGRCWSRYCQSLEQFEVGTVQTCVDVVDLEECCTISM